MKNKETLEEAAEKYVNYCAYNISEDEDLADADKRGFIEGAKWQQERIPSIIEQYLETAFISEEKGYMNPIKWFEQFKNK